MIFPPAGGYCVGTFTVPPASTPPAEGIDVRAALADLEAALPGLFDHNEPDNPGMHTTVTIDFEYVLSGRVVLELPAGWSSNWTTARRSSSSRATPSSRTGPATPGATRSTRLPPSSSC
jgi:hypothetical protein